MCTYTNEHERVYIHKKWHALVDARWPLTNQYLAGHEISRMHDGTRRFQTNEDSSGMGRIALVEESDEHCEASKQWLGCHRVRGEVMNGERTWFDRERKRGWQQQAEV